jgi:hypothetical protein
MSPQESCVLANKGYCAQTNLSARFDIGPVVHSS